MVAVDCCSVFIIPVANGVGISPIRDTGEGALVFVVVAFPDNVAVSGVSNGVDSVACWGWFLCNGCDDGPTDPNKTPADDEVVAGGPLLKTFPGAKVEDPPPDDADRCGGF